MPSGKEIFYHIPRSLRQKLNSFLKDLVASKGEIDPWEELAKEKLEKYKKAGIVLRGARFRENISQVKLAKMSGKIENGKRGVGKKVAKRLSKASKINYLLLLDEDC